MKQCLLITKLIDVLHVHLLGGRQAERWALSPGGRNRRAGFRTPRAGDGSDGKRKKIRTHPSSFLPPDPSAIPTSAASAPPWFPRNGPAPRGTQVKALYSKNASESEHAVSFFFLFLHGQSAPSRAALALLSSRQHTDCVYPQQRKLFVCREEHTACNAICSRQVLVLLCTYSYRGSYPECLWDTANRNKLQQISTDTHRALLNDKSWRRFHRTCFYAAWPITSPLWRLAHLLDRLHMCSSTVTLVAFP